MSYKRFVSLLTGLLGLGLSSSGLAADCSSVEVYVDGAPYSSGDQVAHLGSLYQCDVAGWCSTGGAYEPETGWAWENAWTLVDACDSGDSGGDSGGGTGDGTGGDTGGDTDDGTDDDTGGDTDGGAGGDTGGGAGVSCDLSVWSEVKVYVGSDEVRHKGSRYRANWWNQGADPELNSGASEVWTLVGSCDGSSAPPDDDTGAGGENFGPVMSRAFIEEQEAALTDSDLFRLVKESIQTLDNDLVEAIVPGRSENPENVKRVESIITPADWDFLFPLRHSNYTYTNFLRAAGKYPNFCGTYTDGRDSEAICRKSLATIFAHFTQETGAHDPNSEFSQWRQGLFFVREAGCSNEATACQYRTTCDPNIWQGQKWPCPQGAKYFGRGAKQLTHNFNYGPFSEVIFGDVHVLLEDPDQVATTWLNLASSVFFFMTPQSPKPSMLHVVDGTWEPNAHDLSLGLEPGFGVTTNIINGGIECNTDSGAEKAQSQNRIDYYRGFTNYLEVPIGPDEKLGCADMARFDTQGAGALLINWDQDWTFYPDRPEGKAWACQLVGYQTAYNALIPGDYEKCVTNFFDVTIEE